MSLTGTRTGITYLQSSDGYTLYRTSIENIVAALEAKGALYSQTALGSRPTAGVPGRFWKDSGSLGDGIMFYDNGAGWESIGAGAPTDGAAGTPSLRTLGTSATQAAAGNHTHTAATIGGLDSYLEPWLRPGGSVDLSAQGGGLVDCPVGTTTVVAKPGSGRRVVKSVLIAAPTAGTTVTLRLNGVDVFTRTFANAGFHPPLDVTWPIASGDTQGLQAVVTGNQAEVVAVYGDRTDTLVDRFACVSSSAAGPTDLVSSGTARTFSHLWIANLSTTATATGQVRIGTAAILPLVLGPGDYYSHESAVPITSAQALRFTGDGTAALTYVVSGR